MSEPLTALFVRVPASLATELDERSNAEGRSKQSVVTEILNGAVAPSATDADVILNLDETASLLNVPSDSILERIADGDLPARRFGTSWRFSRAAVLAWMSGSDTLTDHPTGF